MNPYEAGRLALLLHHLDGQNIADPAEIMAGIEDLTCTSSAPIHYDQDVLFDTLCEVAQRFSDADFYDDGERAVEDAETGGAL